MARKAKENLAPPAVKPAVIPAGSKWCNRGGHVKVHAKFRKRARSKDKLQSMCKACSRLSEQTPSGLAANRARVRRYKQTPAGRVTQRRYYQSPAGLAANRAAVHRYHQTPAGLAAVHRYQQSPAGLASRALYRAERRAIKAACEINLTEVERAAIRALFASTRYASYATGIAMALDHMITIAFAKKNTSARAIVHTLANLMTLSASLNGQKGRKNADEFYMLSPQYRMWICAIPEFEVITHRRAPPVERCPDDAHLWPHVGAAGYLWRPLCEDGKLWPAVADDCEEPTPPTDD